MVAAGACAVVAPPDAVASDELGAILAARGVTVLGFHNAWADGEPSATPIWKDCVLLDGSGKWANRATRSFRRACARSAAAAADNALDYARAG